MGQLREYIVTVSTANTIFTKTINTYSAKAAIEGVRLRLDPEAREHAKVFIDTQTVFEKFENIKSGRELLNKMDQDTEAGEAQEAETWYGIRRAPLTAEQRKEKCALCGHTRGHHHNPDDQCIICGCEHFTSYDKKKPI